MSKILTEETATNETLASILSTIPPTSRLVLLACLRELEPLSIGRLADLTGATPGTLVKTVRNLQNQGLLVDTSNRFVHTYRPAPQITLQGRN